jgi:hypothetical protein
VKARSWGLEVTKVSRRLEAECPGFAEETTVLRSIGLTVLATVVAMLSLGCARGGVSPTAPAGDQIYLAKPMLAPAGIISSDSR